MARSSGTEFNFNKAFQIIEALDTNKEVAVTKAIEVSSKWVQKDLDAFFEKGGSNYRTGRTDKSLVTNPKITNYLGRIEMQLGFEAKKGGYVARYFEKGTPRIKPTKFITKAFKNKRAVGAMNYVLGEYWRNGGTRF